MNICRWYGENQQNVLIDYVEKYYMKITFLSSSTHFCMLTFWFFFSFYFTLSYTYMNTYYPYQNMCYCFLHILSCTYVYTCVIIIVKNFVHFEIYMNHIFTDRWKTKKKLFRYYQNFKKKKLFLKRKYTKKKKGSN